LWWWWLPVEVGAASHAVMAEVFLGLLRAVVLPRVRPQQVAHGPERRGLLEAVQLAATTAQTIKRITRRNAINTSELSVQNNNAAKPIRAIRTAVVIKTAIHPS